MDGSKKKVYSEKYLERELAKAIRQERGLCIKLSSMHIKGLPDRLCLLPNRKIFFAEIKTTNLKPTKIQSMIHRKLRGLGFQVFVIDDKESLNKTIEKYGTSP